MRDTKTVLDDLSKAALETRNIWTGESFHIIAERLLDIRDILRDYCAPQSMTVELRPTKEELKRAVEFLSSLEKED